MARLLWALTPIISQTQPSGANQRARVGRDRHCGLAPYVHNCGPQASSSRNIKPIWGPPRRAGDTAGVEIRGTPEAANAYPSLMLRPVHFLIKGIASAGER
ncbi:hypothetical protein B296_00026231 [Ensete ventricosum]|uniref:Uncharacterized protein n=1 Tax=Ensete ventricosum TaxID=4639 RepID=A0A427AEB2_ENSVE|nr:hypothetical protein B296_00026231 [Ensete ventricosum]